MYNLSDVPFHSKGSFITPEMTYALPAQNIVSICQSDPLAFVEKTPPHILINSMILRQRFCNPNHLQLLFYAERFSSAKIYRNLALSDLK